MTLSAQLDLRSQDVIVGICCFPFAYAYALLTENVLLAPTWDSRVSRKDDRIIKAALFDFICTSDRKP